MPIDIDMFNAGNETDEVRVTAKKLLKLLSDNPNKAYCVLDFQNELKTSYRKISSAIRTLKRKHNNQLQFKWVRLSGQHRMIYYAYKKNETLSSKNKNTT